METKITKISDIKENIKFLLYRNKKNNTKMIIEIAKAINAVFSTKTKVVKNRNEDEARYIIFLNIPSSKKNLIVSIKIDIPKIYPIFE